MIVKTKPLISIITPVFNSQDFLSKCINSVIKQSLLNFELILINDGSTDNSGIICDEYAKKYTQIKVIHQDNQGVSVARNRGMYESKGEWLFFLDSDDFLSEDSFSTIKDHLNYDYDLFIFETNVYNNGIISKRSSYTNLTINNTKEFLLTNRIRGELWNYLFKRKIVFDNEIKFVENIRISEDRNFIIKYISLINKVKVINFSLYNYREDNLSSMRRKKTTEDAIDHLKSIKDIVLFQNKNNKYINNEFIQKEIDSLFKIILSFTAISGYSLKEMHDIYTEYSLVFNRIYRKKILKNKCIMPIFFYLSIFYYRCRLS